ncbi:MAG: PQQ-dependent sugar dehydrogenase [Rhodoluna sp.]|nr:PQQ-dependent sugar dehydrogenase [Rhodoluna sp.]
MPENQERRTDPLFEFIVVGSLILGAIFAFGPGKSEATPLPEEKPNPVVVKKSYVEPTGKVQVIASGLRAPWEVVFLPDGQALVDERDSGSILLVSKDLKVTKVGFTNTAPPCEKFCEGGTLGMAIAADRADEKLSLFVFQTTSKDNRILKYDLNTDDAGSWSLAAKRVLIQGIERSGKSTTHNGGRLAIGPDDKLWVSLGDSGMRGVTSQNWKRLAGSILRMNLDGTVPDDNPKKNSFVWAKGLRDTQGMAWDNFGNMWTTEFGQDTWDELNLMEKGKNYGWPIAEGFFKFVETPLEPGNPGSNDQGTADNPAPKPTIPSMPSNVEMLNDSRFTPPVLAWHPSEAACSGITFVRGSLISACLRGGKLWVIPVIGDKQLGEPKEFFKGRFGRLRKATVAPDGSMWIITSNKDGRGGWSSGGENPQDDRIIRVPLKTVYY